LILQIAAVGVAAQQRAFVDAGVPERVLQIDAAAADDDGPEIQADAVVVFVE